MPKCAQRLKILSFTQVGLVYKIENWNKTTRKCNLSKLNQEEIKTNTIKPEAKKISPLKKQKQQQQKTKMFFYIWIMTNTQVTGQF